MSKGFYKVTGPFQRAGFIICAGIRRAKSVKEAIAAIFDRRTLISRCILAVRKSGPANVLPSIRRMIISTCWDIITREQAIMCSRPSEAALAVRSKWQSLTWDHRAAIFLKAADLIAVHTGQSSMQQPCWDNRKMSTRLKLTLLVKWPIFFGSMCIL